DLDALLRQPVEFAYERMRVEDHSVADDRQLAGPDDTRWQQRQLVDLAVDDQRVAGIVPALETHDDVCPLRKPVDDLSLALVTPLRADDHDIGHSSSLRKWAGRLPEPRKQGPIA